MRFHLVDQVKTSYFSTSRELRAKWFYMVRQSQEEESTDPQKCSEPFRGFTAGNNVLFPQETVTLTLTTIDPCGGPPNSLPPPPLDEVLPCAVSSPAQLLCRSSRHYFFSGTTLYHVGLTLFCPLQCVPEVKQQ